MWIENHNELSIRLMNAQSAIAPNSQGPEVSGNRENWTSHTNPFMPQMQ